MAVPQVLFAEQLWRSHFVMVARPEQDSRVEAVLADIASGQAVATVMQFAKRLCATLLTANALYKAQLLPAAGHPVGNAEAVHLANELFAADRVARAQGARLRVAAQDLDEVLRIVAAVVVGAECKHFLLRALDASERRGLHSIGAIVAVYRINIPGWL